ncbi:MAG UNVERIFIED_CONTAM: hypothetical protein LVR18_20965 [Planctomycetaceae bacterium]
MEPQVYAEFVESLGHTVREANGVYWYNIFSHAWISFPLETRLSPAEVDIAGILRGERGGIVRYCSRVEDGAPGFRHVVSGSGYDLQSLEPNAATRRVRGCRSVSAARQMVRSLRLRGSSCTLRR